MGHDSDKDTVRATDNLRMDILGKRLEMYRIMALIFYRRIDDKEKVDALLEAAELIKEEVLDESNE